MADRYDVVGDVHGCLDTLLALTAALGYKENGKHKKKDRRLVFVGDIVSRGRHSRATFDLVRTWVENGRALAVKGNQDIAWTRNRPRDAAFVDALPIQLLLDKDRLLVFHAAIKKSLIGESSDKATFWCVEGAPYKDRGRWVRPDWQKTYRGKPFAVAGHSVVSQVRFKKKGGGSAIIDTGASHGSKAVDRFTGEPFRGYLTALRWPSRKVVSVPTVETDLYKTRR